MQSLLILFIKTKNSHLPLCRSNLFNMTPLFYFFYVQLSHRRYFQRTLLRRISKVLLFHSNHLLTTYFSRLFPSLFFLPNPSFFLFLFFRKTIADFFIRDFFVISNSLLPDDTRKRVLLCLGILFNLRNNRNRVSNELNIV